MPSGSRGAGFIVSILTFTATPAAPPEFRGLGDLPGGIARSAATAVSADGLVVAGFSDSAMGQEAFRWTQDGMLGLGTLGGAPFLSSARGVSDDGTVIVGESVPPGSDPNSVPLHAFRWTMQGKGPGGAMESLGDLAGGGVFAIASGCSADGAVVVGHSSSAASGSQKAEAFRGVGSGNLEALGDLAGGAFFSVATGVSANGERLCGYSSSGASGPSSSEMFLWTFKGGMQPLGDLAGAGFASSGLAISADGSTVVGEGTDTDGTQAVRWTEATGLQFLGDLPGGLVSGRANGVSRDGLVVVGQGHTDIGFRAFVWTPSTGLRDLKDMLTLEVGLNLDGWRLDAATAVSADGRTIVGFGRNPLGQVEAWSAYLGSDCAPPGDVNGDGNVDLTDLGILLSNYGLDEALRDEGDLNGDGRIDIADLSMVLADFGADCP